MRYADQVSHAPRRTRSVFAVLALLALSACASITPYGPAVKNRPGYTSQQLEADKFRVTFEGNSSTDRATIENYVLYRAAEVTLESGNDYFIILDSSTDAMRSFRTTGTTFGGGGFGRRGFFYGGGFRRGGFGGVTSTTRERTSYITGAIIQVARGDKPSDNPDAYDARQLIDNLRPTLTFAEAQN
ncbi:MAG: hypothetical protein AAGJ73_16215 [Pseudomonadota bacterium]